MAATRWFAFGCVAVAVVLGTCMLLQRQEAAALRTEIGVLEQDSRQLGALRAEHQRRLAEKISDEELARLRNDRAALLKLRSEIERLNAEAEQRARRLQSPADGRTVEAKP